MKRALLGSICLLSACTQSGSLPSGPTPHTIMVGVATQIQQCWFKKKNPIFAPYKMATELDSYSGKPRILIVPKNNPAGLPKLVAQSERKNGRNQFSSFGPLLATKNGPQLNAQLSKWASGVKTC